MKKQKAVAYFRVSTQKQGTSGLGLEAQRTAVMLFAGKEYEIVEEFTDIESGKNNDRTELDAAITRCKKDKAVLLIAKLDRLSRDVHFISGLMKTKVQFIEVDNPITNNFMRHIKAAFAEHEREQISERTKKALQAAKARGVKLGTPNHNALATTMKTRADTLANELKPSIEAMQAKGFKSVRGLARAFNKRPSQMHYILKRLKQINGK